MHWSVHGEIHVSREVYRSTSWMVIRRFSLQSHHDNRFAIILPASVWQTVPAEHSSIYRMEHGALLRDHLDDDA